MTSKITCVLALCLGLIAGQSFAGDCNEAQKDYEKALAEGSKENWQSAKQWLQKALHQCNRFQYWYRLGQSEQALKNYDAAASAYTDAIQYATNNDQNALAVARYAEINSLEGKDVEALTLIHKARKQHSHPPEWMENLARKLEKETIDRPLEVSQITRGLNNRAIKLLKMDAKPNINIRINFETNSTSPVADAVKKIDILAKALASETLQGRKFTIVGHADERGENHYNQDLSEKRAQYIASKVIQKEPSLKGRLLTRGKGENEPLFKGHTAEDYLLNRRIEVQAN